MSASYPVLILRNVCLFSLFIVISVRLAAYYINKERSIEMMEIKEERKKEEKREKTKEKK
jgi:hypothetical protein